MNPTSMRAVIFEQFGNPADVLRIQEDVPLPEPRSGEVRVRMLLSPINPSDLLYIQGNYGIQPRLPATPGFEGVGIVEATGGGLLAWLRKGKRVAVLNAPGGNWRQWVTLPARQVVPVPDDLSDEQAASFFVNPATALVMTRHVLRIRRGEWLLQTAAGGALGRMIVQLGKRDGFRTINVVRRRHHADELTALGADAVIVDPEEVIRERVMTLTGEQGVPYAIDAVGGATGSRAALCLAPGGRLLLYGLLSGESVLVDPRMLLSRNQRIEGFWLSTWVKTQGVLTLLRLFRQIKELVREGVLQSPVGPVYGLDEVTEAVRAAGREGKDGKVFLRLGESRG